MSTSIPARPLRADAARNRALLLGAAEAEFAVRGIDASIADIARRAGVAKATVFRHFATKEMLIAEIVSGHYAKLTSAARQMVDSPDPGAALLEFLTVAADGLQHQDLAFLQIATEGDPVAAELQHRLLASIELLVDRARDAGALRPDVTGADVLLLVCAPVHIAGFLSDPAPDLWRRYVTIIFDGLRPEGASPLSPEAPSWL